ncbi:MAG: hypothetical protein QXK24_00125 [Ignisphaera sp.]
MTEGYRYLVVCRQGYTIRIPCDYNKDGYCGIDGKPCEFKWKEV